MSDFPPSPLKGYDEKDFVVVRCVEDITSRPDFRPEIDLIADPIKQPLGSHPFKMICGRKGCQSHREHHRGYIIRTQSGKTTVIGWKCGADLLADWGLFTNMVDAKNQQLRDRETLRGIEVRMFEIRGDVAAMRTRSRGLDWLAKSLENFNRSCPKRLLSNLKQRALKPGGDAIHHEEELTAQEREDLKAMGTAGPKDTEFRRKLVGRLKGLDVLKKAPDKILWKGVLEPLKLLEDFGSENVPIDQLRRLAMRCGQIDYSLLEMEYVLQNVQQFFTEDNFSQFLLLHLDAATEREVKQFKWDFGAGERLQQQRVA